VPTSPRCRASACRCRRLHGDHRALHPLLRQQRELPAELKDEVEAALAAVEKTVGAGFGDANNPLLVSVRSGARASMPGMMDTVLNLGPQRPHGAGLAKSSGDERFAWDSYRRFIQMYSNVVLDVGHHYFEEALELKKEDLGVHMDTDLKSTTGARS
jgi:pyruvate,orthophosphate dikinase